MKKLTLGAIAASLVIVATMLTSLDTISGFIPYAYAEDVEDLKQIVITNTKTSNTIAINMKIERLERRADRLRDKDVLTQEEKKILTEYEKEITKLEDDLDK